jgi:energy-coupling factor transporter ATP-binding protein EcfA2
MIAIESLSYSYPNQSAAALSNINLRVRAGEFVLLAGPSGSGKSTLLRCLNGLVPHFTGGTISGTVTVNDLDVLSLGPPALSQHVGFVLQTPEAQAVLDRVEPEIAFGLENAGLPPQEMRVRVEEVLDLLDLLPLRRRLLSTLSGGERQRVAIAAALALRPTILVLDEPTSQLDPQSAEEVFRALVRLNEDLGLTIVLAEHRLERVMRYTDRVIYLDQGQVLIDDAARVAVSQMPQLPPLIQLGRALGWQPLPLTVKEGRRFARELTPRLPVQNSGTNGSATASSAQSSVLLEATDLHFSYNGEAALNGVTLRIAPGEAVAIMGRNGSGKSTLLKCLVGLLSPGAGQVAVNGRSTRGRKVADICREVAYLPQNPDDLLFSDSVAEELLVTLRNHGISGSQKDVWSLLAMLGLADVAESYPRDLSVGQRQRVALGAVTITNPNLLLLDEPTRGLDYEAKQTLVGIWRNWMAAGMGLLLVTHDVELVAMIADRVLILSQGEIIAAGKTANVVNTSPLFAPQIAKLFPDQGWLTLEEALAGMRLAKGENDA